MGIGAKITRGGENTKLTNEMRLLQVDFQAMKQMIEQQRFAIEHLARENGRMLKRLEEKEPEQEKQGICCCPTTQEAHDAELQRMFDDEWELILSSHAIVSAQKRYMPGGKLDWNMLEGVLSGVLVVVVVVVSSS